MVRLVSSVRRRQRPLPLLVAVIDRKQVAVAMAIHGQRRKLAVWCCCSACRVRCLDLITTITRRDLFHRIHGRQAAHRQSTHLPKAAAASAAPEGGRAPKALHPPGAPGTAAAPCWMWCAPTRCCLLLLPTWGWCCVLGRLLRVGCCSSCVSSCSGRHSCFVKVNGH